MKVVQTKFKDIQGPGGKKSSFSRTFKDFKDNFKNSRISRFLKDRGNHASLAPQLTTVDEICRNEVGHYAHIMAFFSIS